MLDSDRQKFGAIVTALSEYYRVTLSSPVIEIYWRGLRPYDVAAVERAAELHMANPEHGQFMPKVSDFVRLIEGATGDRALKAWSQVHEAIKRIGPYQTVVFDDPLVHVVLAELGGWIDLCNVETKDMPFRANEFCTRYRSHAVQRSIPNHQPKLVGIIEGDCRVRGFLQHIPPPMLIGDVDQARRVLAAGTARAGVLKYQADDFIPIGKVGELPAPESKQ